MKPHLLDGRYELRCLRVAGPITETYDGVDRERRCNVIVEVLAKGFSRDRSSVALFGDAIRAAASLDHPNIARVTGPAVAEGVHYAVQEIHHGRPLGQLIAQRGPLPPALAATFAFAMAEALDHAHRQGVAHGALTPVDILVTGTTLQLSGFGLAAKTPYRIDGRYCAPERAVQVEGDALSDLYALGCCLHEMLVGHPPDPGAGANALVSRVLGAGLVALVERLTARRPEDRYQSAEALLPDLWSLIQRSPTPTPLPLLAHPPSPDPADTPHAGPERADSADPGVVPEANSADPSAVPDAVSEFPELTVVPDATFAAADDDVGAADQLSADGEPTVAADAEVDDDASVVAWEQGADFGSGAPRPEATGADEVAVSAGGDQPKDPGTVAADAVDEPHLSPDVTSDASDADRTEVGVGAADGGVVWADGEAEDAEDFGDVVVQLGTVRGEAVETQPTAGEAAGEDVDEPGDEGDDQDDAEPVVLDGDELADVIVLEGDDLVADVIYLDVDDVVPRREESDAAAPEEGDADTTDPVVLPIPVGVGHDTAADPLELAEPAWAPAAQADEAKPADPDDDSESARRRSRRLALAATAVVVPLVGVLVALAPWDDGDGGSADGEQAAAEEETPPPNRTAGDRDRDTTGDAPTTTDKPTASTERTTTTSTTTTAPPTTTSPPTTTVPQAAANPPRTPETSPSRTVPNVMSMSESEARAVLADHGFETSVAYVPVYVDFMKDSVLWQQPLPDSSAPPGSTVRIGIGA